MMSDDVSRVGLAALQRYLVSQGWVLASESTKANFLVYFNAFYDANIYIPASERYRDFSLSLSKTLETLADFENSSVQSIINDILSICLDRIEFRIISGTTSNGTIPLDYAAECIDGIKELVLFSAAAELKKAPVCYRPTKEAYFALQSFNFAQTSKGSFVFNVDTLVSKPDCEQLSIVDDVHPKSINHSVVKRIQTAMEQVSMVSSGTKQLTSITNVAFETGITANMCDAFLKIRPNEWDSALETTFKYSKALSKEIEVKSSLKLQEQDFLVISEIAKVYYDRKEVEFVALTGFVRSLSKRGIRDTDEFEKVIRLQVNYKEQDRTIRIELSEDYYIIACNAHRDGKEVRVTGDLDMSSRLWTLSNIQSFSQIP